MPGRTECSSAQNGTLFQTYELFIAGISFTIFIPLLSETVESRTLDVVGVQLKSAYECCHVILTIAY
jgi:hypothetical protein